MSTAVAACPDVFGIFSYPNDHGVSPDSVRIWERIRESKEHFQDYITGQQLQRLLSELDSVFVECSKANWDGYNAEPISSDAYLEAIEFLRLLPPFMSPPEIVPEPDGEIAFEWLQAEDRLFVVGLSGNNTITYSGMFGSDEKIYGTEHFVDSLPRIVTEKVQYLFHACK